MAVRVPAPGVGAAGLPGRGVIMTADDFGLHPGVNEAVELAHRDGVLNAVRQYAALARAHGLTPAQLALAWCGSRWFVAATIIGATNLAQLKENIDAFELTLADDVIAEINAIHNQLPDPGQ